MENNKDKADPSQASDATQADAGFNYMILNSIQGEQGFQGFQGEQGFQGNQGNQGSRGDQGFQGTQGFQGNQGEQGSQGNQGFQGSQGDQGNQGNQGEQGSQGNQGFQGGQGGQGDQGNQGFQGSQGNQGNQGSQGSQGEQGSQGHQGFQGDEGNQGTQGGQGNQGNQGNQGFQGGQGEQGNQGFQGYQGNQGAPGSGGGVPQGSVILLRDAHPPEGFTFTGIQLMPSSLSRSFIANSAPDPAPMPVGRAWAAVLSAYDTIYVFGGKSNGNVIDANSNLVQVYDTKKNTWSNMAVLPSSRYGATAVFAFSSALYLFGGTQDGINYMRDNDANLAGTNGKWISSEAPMPVATAGALGASFGTQLLILGGNYNGANSILQSYNPYSKRWSAAVNTPAPNITGGATVLVNSYMYILGASAQKFAMSNTPPVYGYYDILKNTYTPIPPPPANSEVFFPSAVLMDDRIYVAGGFKRDGTLSTQVFILDYKSNAWYNYQLPIMQGATNAVAGVGNGAMFILGGSATINGPAVNTVQGTNSNTFFLMQKD